MESLPVVSSSQKPAEMAVTPEPSSGTAANKAAIEETVQQANWPVPNTQAYHQKIHCVQFKAAHRRLTVR